MVEITRREKTEEELKVIEEARKASGKWMGEETMADVKNQNQKMVKELT